MFVYIQQVFVEVTPSNFESLRQALTINSTPPVQHEVMWVNGTCLWLLVPSEGVPALAVTTWEHMSHDLWSHLNEAGRLQLHLGFHAVLGMLAAALDRPAPLTDNLTAAIVAKTLPATGMVVGSGAYREACMRCKLFVYIAMYGEEQGRSEWQAWYTSCKARAGDVVRFFFSW